MLQWGTARRTGYSTLTDFPVAFPSVCLGVFLTQDDIPASLTNSMNNIHAANATRTGFLYMSDLQEVSASWFALGV
ncbi:hypothetical protein D5P88_25565 [Salmonella enterica subsp. enterica]|nr:hypothetical protein [Salmonella enterica subsp. enterica]